MTIISNAKVEVLNNNSNNFKMFIYRFKNILFSNGTDQSSNAKKKVYACLVSSSWIKLSWFCSYELWRPIATFPWGTVWMLLRSSWWHYKVAWNTVQMSWKLYSETSSKGTYYSQCFHNWPFKITNVTIRCQNNEMSSTKSWVGCLLKVSELFILFAENSQILHEISVISILLTLMYLVALNMLVNNQLNSLSNSTHHCGQ